MRTIEAAISGALVLIGLYLLFYSQNASNIINSLATGGTNIVRALQGRG